MDYNEEEAKNLFVEYFRLIFNKIGLEWNEKNEGEIADLMGYMIRAARFGGNGGKE